jgi:hypothetical protein
MRPSSARDKRSLPTPQALPPCPPALQGEHRAQEDGEDVREQSRVLEEYPPHPVRKGQRPLSIRHVRQHPLHQVRRRHMRPLRIAGRAHPSSLAREGDEKFVLTTLTAHPREAVRQHSTLQVPGEVPLHVPGQAAPQLARLRQQRGEVVPHRRIQHRPLRPPLPVLPPVRPHQPLPSHTSPGHTLPPGSHETPPGPLWEWRRQVRFPPLPMEVEPRLEAYRRSASMRNSAQRPAVSCRRRIRRACPGRCPS